MTTLRASGKQIKALLPADVWVDLDRLRSHLGLSTYANTISIAIRKLAISEFHDKNQAASHSSRGAA
jgi:hypothetical protein